MVPRHEQRSHSYMAGARRAGGEGTDPERLRHYDRRALCAIRPGGSAEARYLPSGFEAEFIIPARHVSEPRSFAGPAIKFPRHATNHPVPPPPKFLARRNTMLVEDSLIISLDAEDILLRLGAEAVSTHATAQGALDALADGAPVPSVAILDINLGDKTSFPVADRLLELGIPFLFASGYGEQALLPMEHRNRQVLQNPYTMENIATALAELLLS